MTEFWKHKRLDEMSPTEWEALCDGCGKCCLNKIIDDDTDELYYTDAACKLLDRDECRCRHYSERFAYVPGCAAITADNIAELDWLPESCAYIRLYKGRELPSWHPLLTGSKEAMHAAGMSVRGRAVCETKVRYLDEHIVLWPLLDCD